MSDWDSHDSRFDKLCRLIIREWPGGGYTLHLPQHQLFGREYTGGYWFETWEQAMAGLIHVIENYEES